MLCPKWCGNKAKERDTPVTAKTLTDPVKQGPKVQETPSASMLLLEPGNP